jgi:hypothetical protein
VLRNWVGSTGTSWLDIEVWGSPLFLLACNNETRDFFGTRNTFKLSPAPPRAPTPHDITRVSTASCILITLSSSAQVWRVVRAQIATSRLLIEVASLLNIIKVRHGKLRT